MTIGLDKLGFVLRWEMVEHGNALYYSPWSWILMVDNRILDRLPRLLRVGHIPDRKVILSVCPALEVWPVEKQDLITASEDYQNQDQN